MPCPPASPSPETEPAPPDTPSRCEIPWPARVHHPECACLTCSQLQTGLLAYRELAEALASDDPAILDPLWRRLCQQRVDAYNLRTAHEATPGPAPSPPLTDD